MATVDPELETIAISLPRPIIEVAQRLAASQDCSMAKFLEQLIVRSERDARWKNLLAYGRERGLASGYTEDDVVGLVKETRREIAEEKRRA